MDSNAKNAKVFDAKNAERQGKRFSGAFGNMAVSAAPSGLDGLAGGGRGFRCAPPPSMFCRPSGAWSMGSRNGF